MTIKVFASDKEEYQKFFQEKLKKYDVDSPSSLSKEDKSKFFTEIEKEWTKDSTVNVWAKIEKISSL